MAAALLVLNPADDVAVLTAPAPAGSRPLGEGAPLAAMVPRGHKIARREIPSGAPIRKFGQIIGYATRLIALGEHLHVQNCAMGEHERAYEPGADLAAARAAVPKVGPRFWNGYRRAEGSAGTRNYIALCATVNCSATVIRHAARAVEASGILAAYPEIDGVLAVTHDSGCGMGGGSEGIELLERTLWGHASHPNVGAAIFVGLGCEMLQIGRMKSRYGEEGAGRFHSLTIQENGGTAATIRLILDKIRELAPEVGKARREPLPASLLTLGMQCGGSDGLSGITANPALGVASDLLVAQGGASVLSETPEIYGAEQLLLRRAESEEVARKLIERIKWWEDYVARHGGSLDNNPSPGNKAGGLTTILEKSLGATAKAGHAPLAEVLGYAEPIRARGLIFMDTPGYDPVSATGQIAGGAQLIAFTTGRGSAFGSKPAPTIKIASNDRLYESMPDDMDLNCGDVVSQGASLEAKGAEIFEKLLATASGAKTKSEALGFGDHEFAPWRLGAVV